MSCARLDELLSQTPSADALAHAKGCAECGPARAAWVAMQGEVPSGAALQAVQAAARAELRAQPRARSWTTDALIVVGLNAAIVVLASVALRTPLLHPDWTLARWGIAAALAAIVAAGGWAAVRPGARGLRLAALGLAGLGALAVGLGGSGLSGGRPFGSGVACALTEVVVSGAPFLVALWVTSRFAFDFTRAIVAGISVGATGMLVLHLHCLNGAVDHLFVFHVLPWFVIGLGAAALRRIAPTRSFAP